jgi:hypothetical protein
MNRQLKVWMLLGAIVVSVGILGGVVYPLLSGEHYEYYNLINLTSDDRTQALMITMNSSDTLYYQFRATGAVVFWVKDPAGNQVVDPNVYVRLRYGSGFKLVAKSSGVYSLMFSSDVPNQQVLDLVMVEVRSGITPQG